MKAIEKLRAAGFTRSQIAAALGVSRHAVRYWETGERSPNHDNREKLMTMAESRGILLLGSDFSTKKD
jgi:DNA-binding transcriptional regulator YiaG